MKKKNVINLIKLVCNPATTVLNRWVADVED
jgi:hypothetical protein